MGILQSLVIIGLVALTACSDAITTDATPRPLPLSDTEREALAAKANAPIFDGMGNHHHGIGANAQQSIKALIAAYRAGRPLRRNACLGQVQHEVLNCTGAAGVIFALHYFIVAAYTGHDHPAGNLCMRAGLELADLRPLALRNHDASQVYSLTNFLFPEDMKVPGLGQVMIRRPSRHLDRIEYQLSIDGLFEKQFCCAA